MKLFISQFWRHFTLLTGINHKCSTAYHLQMNGTSKWSNKTLIQALCFHVKHNQKGWVAALPRICFNLTCTINKSTGYTPFMLGHGRNPLILPPLKNTWKPIMQDKIDAHALLIHLHKSLNDAKDNLLTAKIAQAFEANKSHFVNDPFPYAIDDTVLLSTASGKCAAKFSVHFNGPYAVIDVHPAASNVTLNLSYSNIFPTFHISLINRPCFHRHWKTSLTCWR